MLCDLSIRESRNDHFPIDHDDSIFSLFCLQWDETLNHIFQDLFLYHYLSRVLQLGTGKRLAIDIDCKAE